jgi:hypothetical protein
MQCGCSWPGAEFRFSPDQSVEYPGRLKNSRDNVDDSRARVPMFGPLVVRGVRMGGWLNVRPLLGVMIASGNGMRKHVEEPICCRASRLTRRA